MSHTHRSHSQRIATATATVLLATAAVAALVVRRRILNVGANGFGLRTTPRQVLAAANRNMRGSNILVTGARHGGLGFETALSLARTGAHVWVHARDQALAERTVHDMRAQSDVPIDVSPIACDLSDLDDVRAMTSRLLAIDRPLDALVCSAAVIFEQKKLFTRQGHDLYIGVNHFAHALMAFRLLPLLRRAAANAPADVGARVVVLTADVHSAAKPENLFKENDSTNDFVWMQSYADSKLANLLFVRQFERLFGAEGVHAYALNPGIIRTNFYRRLESDSSSTSRLLAIIMRLLHRVAGKTIEQGSATPVYCTVTPGIPGGEYYEDSHISSSKSSAITAPELGERFWRHTQSQLEPFLAADAKTETTHSKPTVAMK